MVRRQQFDFVADGAAESVHLRKPQQTEETSAVV